MTGKYGYTDELLSLPLSFDAQLERRKEWLAMKCPDCGKTMMKGKPCATCKPKGAAKKGKPMPKGATKPKRPFPLAKEELGL